MHTLSARVLSFQKESCTYASDLEQREALMRIEKHRRRMSLCYPRGASRLCSSCSACERSRRSAMSSRISTKVVEGLHTLSIRVVCACVCLRAGPDLACPVMMMCCVDHAICHFFCFFVLLLFKQDIHLHFVQPPTHKTKTHFTDSTMHV